VSENEDSWPLAVFQSRFALAHSPMAVFSRNVPNSAAAVYCCCILVLQIPDPSTARLCCPHYAPLQNMRLCRLCSPPPHYAEIYASRQLVLDSGRLWREPRDRQLRTRQLRNQVDKSRGDTYSQPPFAPFYPCTAGLTAAEGGAPGNETGRHATIATTAHTSWT
jgi:hypothetical protein